MKLVDLPNLSTKRLKALSESGIDSLLDLLNWFPHRYLDRTTVLPIRQVKGQGEEVTVVGRIQKIRQKGYGKKKRLEVILQDDTASLKGVWFKGGHYIKKQFSEDDAVAFFGKAKQYGRYVSMAHPEWDKIDDTSDIQDLKQIVPIYPSNKTFSKRRITSKLIHQWQKVILKHERPPEFLPAKIRDQHNLPKRHESYRMIHFPESQSEYKQAFKRFKFEELFLFELSVAKTKHEIIERNEGALFTDLDQYTQPFFNEHLPFELTEGQKSALADIKKDVRSGKQMNRLIQGDVGSGKTIVALGAILMALDNGYQAAFMAPTEILAEQHYRTLSNFLDPLDVNVRLLVGNQKTSLRTDILTDIEGGNCDIVVGTHAVIQDEVNFNNLGLAVIDEQHRFGVKQRAEILTKGSHPHVLVMSATPIPRSLAMTLYSDLDISIIKGLPGGRKPVKTAVRHQSKHDDIYNFVEQELREGGQAYVVYPLVEESEKMDLKDATAGYKKLKKRFSDFEVGLLHGQMKSEEKDAVMQQFINNDIQVLVSTTVIEVGVDVPNASIMIVEHAERFGLSQLHQLRGRIGRGKRQSYCILVHGQKVSKEGKFRLRKMAQTSDGFEIAEADLKLRGPGDFLGTKQSGLPEFRVADIVEDQWILEQAKSAAWEIMNDDPDLQKPEYQKLKEVFIPYYKEKSKFYGMG
ncbi:ATP-dependent DNA helicase RecG [Aliifodinibius salipaludis]|uniref:ATP-dependent DNA helicase RecG n=1 Tax=Fodinibius salipaludis TaxID=2032627 RepID=A0A2A2G7T5_9BACT|nr:ATP-dependent DNA helicase RecG [Aliifodinibius salipaludis]PAU93064.1 ATP-dependent DNA helicase RecG [Aliifodinibius salipaludis]